MKITLIEPAMIKRPGFSEKPMFTFQPLTLAWLAGITPPGIEVEVLDDRIEPIDYDAPRDLVGISVKTFSARRAYEIAAQFRRRGVRVVLGGHHPSLAPQEALEHADAVVIGEAETVWQRLLADCSHGRLERIYRGQRQPDYPSGEARRAVFAGKSYIPTVLIETSRGCPYQCSFCSVSAFFGRSYRARTVRDIVAEIERLGQRRLFFVDDNIAGSRESATQLFQALIPLKIQWIAQASLGLARDPQLMDLMQRSGCAGVLVGLESLAPRSLQQIRKSWNIRQPYAESLRALRARGIAVVGSFIIGLDEDTPASLDATLEFAVEQKLFAAMFNLLVPYPGTDLYHELETAGRLLYPRWWLDPAYAYGKAAYRPRHFSPLELEGKRLELYRRFYGASSLLRRVLDLDANARDPWHLFMYLALNLPAYPQEQQRQGRALGSETRNLDGTDG